MFSFGAQRKRQKACIYLYANAKEKERNPGGNFWPHRWRRERRALIKFNNFPAALPHPPRGLCPFLAFCRRDRRPPLIIFSWSGKLIPPPTTVRVINLPRAHAECSGFMNATCSTRTTTISLPYLPSALPESAVHLRLCCPIVFRVYILGRKRMGAAVYPAYLITRAHIFYSSDGVSFIPLAFRRHSIFAVGKIFLEREREHCFSIRGTSLHWTEGK